MKILILGAKGNLGQAFAEIYSKENPDLWDKDELDITNETEVLKKLGELKPELVINCAAYNAVDTAETEEGLAMAINGEAVGYLAAACKSINATIVSYSTHYVFDGESPGGYNEDDKPSAQSAYARSKILGEELLQKSGAYYYLIRTAWLYGKTSQGKKSFVDLMLQQSQNGTDVKVVDNEFGHPTFVKDLAQTTNELIIKKFPFGIYHLVNEGSASWYEWAREIFRIKNLEVNVLPVPASNFPRAVLRPHYGVLNNTKGPRMRPWQDALKEFLNT